MITKPIGVNQDVRRAVRDWTKSRAGLCRAAAIDQGLLSAFMSGRKRLGVASLDRLAEALGFQITLRRKPGRKAPKRRR